MWRVLQHTVASNAALGRYAWVFGGLDASVGALEEMKAVADSKGVKVFLGYNKNVTDYVTKAREFKPLGVLHVPFYSAFRPEYPHA